MSDYVDYFPTLLAEISPTALFVLGLLVIGVVLLRRFRLSRRSACAPASSRGGSGLSDPTTHPLNPPAKLTQWEVQMHDTARELSGQLDSKIGILQHMIAAAAHETERLESVLAELREVQQRLAAASATEKNTNWSAPRPSEPGSELDWLARRVGSSGSAADGATQISPEHRQQILAMAKGGYSRAAISHQVGVPLGDVEMVLSLPRE